MKTKKQEQLEKAVENMRQMKMETLYFEEAFLQTIWATGDEKMGEIVKNCSENGFGMARWYGIATKQFRDLISSQLQHMSNQPFGEQPWNFIDIGYSSTFLEMEWNKTMQNQPGIQCKDNCNTCGVCKNQKIKK